ncbi:hypothetical protein M3M33_14635, partial [Loigolactobacillus coryniformis]|uniref:hypothetical protein n=1 Tax=Loigolactobacillus coryniformis TaxID=1610 RepID=UPI00201A23E5
SDSNKNRSISPEHRAKLKEGFYKYYNSKPEVPQERRDKIRLSLLGRKPPEKAIQKAKEVVCRKITILGLEDSIVFESATQCAKYLGVC